MSDQIKYWDSVSSTKEFTTPFKKDLFNQFIEKNAKILDFGCGYGRIIKELKANGYSNITGIDFSREMIIRAKKDFPDLLFIHNDKDKLPFDNESFDVVIIAAVLTCIADDRALDKLIDEVKRILKNGGFLYINDFLINSDERNLRRYKEQDRDYPYGVFRLDGGALLRHFRMERIKELLSIFDTVCLEETSYKTMNGNTSNGFYYLGKK